MKTIKISTLAKANNIFLNIGDLATIVKRQDLPREELKELATFAYRMDKVSKQIGKVKDLQDFMFEQDLLRIKYSSVDADKNVIRDDKGGRKFTQENETLLVQELKTLGEKEIEFEACKAMDRSPFLATIFGLEFTDLLVEIGALVEAELSEEEYLNTYAKRETTHDK